MYGVRAPDRLHAGFRQAEVLDLPFADEILDRSRPRPLWNVRVNTTPGQHVDAIGFQPLQRSVRNLPDVSGTAIQTGRLSGFERLKPNLVAIATLSCTGARASPTSVSFVNRPYVRLYRRTSRHDRTRRRSMAIAFLMTRGRTIAGTDTHAAESEGCRLRVHSFPMFAVHPASSSRPGPEFQCEKLPKNADRLFGSLHLRLDGQPLRR